MWLTGPPLPQHIDSHPCTPRVAMWLSGYAAKWSPSPIRALQGLDGGSGKNPDLGSGGSWEPFFNINSNKRIAQKLRRIILLHFGLMTFHFHFPKNQKVLKFMIFGPSDPKTNYLWLWLCRITSNNEERTQIICSIVFWKSQNKKNRKM